jgi:hypothetical protein
MKFYLQFVIPLDLVCAPCRVSAVLDHGFSLITKRGANFSLAKALGWVGYAFPFN